MALWRDDSLQSGKGCGSLCVGSRQHAPSGPKPANANNRRLRTLELRRLSAATALQAPNAGEPGHLLATRGRRPPDRYSG
jgi:hypothetical protein